MIQIKNDKFVLATNSDIEIYGLVPIVTSNDATATTADADNLNFIDETNQLKIKELKKYLNTHRDSILCLEKITGSYYYFLGFAVIKKNHFFLIVIFFLKINYLHRVLQMEI